MWQSITQNEWPELKQWSPFQSCKKSPQKAGEALQHVTLKFWAWLFTQRVDNAIHMINHYPVDKRWQNKLDSDLSAG